MMTEMDESKIIRVGDTVNKRVVEKAAEAMEMVELVEKNKGLVAENKELRKASRKLKGVEAQLKGSSAQLLKYRSLNDALAHENEEMKQEQKTDETTGSGS